MRQVRAAAILLLGAALMAARPLPAEGGEPVASRDLALEAKRLLDGGDLPASLSAFRAAREVLESSAPPDAELADFVGLHLFNLGVRFNNAGDAQRAVTCFIEALRVARTVRGRLRDRAFQASLREATLKVAGFLVASGKPDPAVDAYQLLAEGSAGDIEGWVGLGAAHLARGDFAAALAAYDRAAIIRPDSPDVAAGRGHTALMMARRAEQGEMLALIEKAAGWLRRASDLEPSVSTRHGDLAGALVDLGSAAALAGDVARALAVASEADEEYRRAVALEPSLPLPRFDLANRLLRTRRYEEAAAEFEQAGSALDGLMTSSPGDANVGAWRAARVSSRESRAVALFNLAVDAINRAEFNRVEPYLSAACAVGPSWDARCREMREAARVREATFRQAVVAHESALKEDPRRAADLLALGDLYAGAGQYARALEYYRRIETAGSPVPDLADRIAAALDPGPLTEHSKSIDLPGSHLEVRHFAPTLDGEFERALKAAWLRVRAALGDEALQGPLLVTVYPNRRVFRENAGYRVGSMVKGNYTLGHASVFQVPSHTALEWVAVLTHEIAHHAVTRLSGGQAPRWLSEGVARYVEGDSAVVDRARLRARLQAGALQPTGRLDEVMDRAWNDAVTILDARDEALLAVEEMARRHGSGGLTEILVRMANPSADFGAVVRISLGADLAEIDAAWRALLAREGP